MTTRRARACVPLLLVWLWLLLLPLVPAAQEARTVTLAIVRADGVIVYFHAERADSVAERRRGLMGRSTLPRGHGMWFDFKTSQQVSMWMKNTLIPLDILFVDSSRRVLSIGRGEPHDTTLIRSPAPVRYVLEISAGSAAALQLAVGDTVSVR